LIGGRYVECTSAAIQALASFKKLYPGHRRKDVDNCINKAANYIESIQRSDGSWLVFTLHVKEYNYNMHITFCIVLYLFFCRYGSWAVCFTYGTWFGVKALVAAGRTFKSSPAIRKACDFLMSKELSFGGWGESYLSCQDQVHSFLFSLWIYMQSCLLEYIDIFESSYHDQDFMFVYMFLQFTVI
jgi:cycloartenol synthase